jgi:hypothetical protein
MSVSNFDLRRGVFCFGILACASVAVYSQTPSPTPDEESEFIVPARPSVSNPAQFQRPGVLQLEIGTTANFRARNGYRDQQDVPMALRFAVSRRILIELDTDSPYSPKELSGVRETGAGDTQLGIQAVILPESETRPGIALAYYIKLPTADERKGLGTGRVDHSFVGLFSKTTKRTTVDLNAVYLLAGSTLNRGHSSSGQAALALTQSLTKRFGVQGEISGNTRNDEQRGVMQALGVATYQISRRAVVDGGVRFGLTPFAPKVGVVAGITFGIANLYRSHH